MKQLILAGLLALGAAGEARALNLTGTIVDSAGVPIPGIRVEVNHLGAAVELRDVVFADSSGIYNSAAVQPGDNVYLVVSWNFALQPAAAVGGHVVTVVARGAGDPFVAAQTYLLKLSPTVPNVTVNLVINLAMNQMQPAGLANVPLRLSQVLQYIHTNKGPTPWSLTSDIPVNLVTDGNDRLQNSALYISQSAFDGSGSSFDIVTAFHEAGHFLHSNHNGPGGLPDTEAGCGSHSINSEEGPICALIEGYPSYLAQLVAEANGVLSPFYRGYRDDGINTVGAPPNSLWRGDEAAPTGRDGASWESGSRVEGAVSGFLFEVHNAFGFQTVFDALVTETPETALGVLIGISDKFGVGTPLTLAVNAAGQQHGLVYGRGRFVTNPFAAPAAPASAPPSPGNFKQINGFSFLRGVVPTKISAVEPGDLGIDTFLTGLELRIGLRTATPGVLDPPSFLPATPWIPLAVGLADLDTRAFDAADGDGDWDLGVTHRNFYQFADDFLPNWLGDGTFELSSDELFLKTVGTWYDHDNNPLTDTDKQGMVIVDNTAPTLSNFKPQP